MKCFTQEVNHWILLCSIILFLSYCNDIPDREGFYVDDFSRLMIGQNSLSVEGENPLVFTNPDYDTIAYSIDRYNRPYFELARLDSTCISFIDTISTAKNYTYYVVRNSTKCRLNDLGLNISPTFEYTIFVPSYTVARESYLYKQGFDYLEEQAKRNLQIYISCNEKDTCSKVIARIVKLVD